ncbi:MAG: DUF2911 domain-containing protein, partial [Acidobacteria bacterium]|nr:DUF2911 domain-containing protein [Acidobacteriota bacterium]
MMYRNFVIFLALTFWAAACSSPQTAEQPAASSGEQAEPAPSGNRGTAEITLGATQVSINYGRPGLQGRDMLSQLQDGQVWRLGMNDATTFETSSDLMLGDTVLQAGRYSIWAKKVSSEDWRLIFNSEPDVGGLNHNPANDIVEIPPQQRFGASPVSAEAMMTPPEPTFTVATEKNPVPAVPGMFTMPSLNIVAPRATMSGTGVADAEKSKVLTPVNVPA